LIRKALPDFGTYHCTTPRSSEEARERARRLFTRALDDLPLSRSGNLKVLDVGCGLGFLTCLCAEFYPNSSVVGLDTFDHPSLKGSSAEKARRNAESMGVAERTSFERGDVLEYDCASGEFDLIVSNLVFHNLGKKRLDAYGRIARWAVPKASVLVGDIFFNYEVDRRILGSLFERVRTYRGPKSDGSYRVLALCGPARA
jgi:cyclopropane fatty-acyl-phospholipid synthase-like methyltransferase